MSFFKFPIDPPEAKPKFTRFGHIWSREDDELLRIAVELHGNKPQWDSIAKVSPSISSKFSNTRILYYWYVCAWLTNYYIPLPCTYIRSCGLNLPYPERPEPRTERMQEALEVSPGPRYPDCQTGTLDR
ncbi:hypothetical protein EON63_12365 [archaeon]|nr:MAG: hypothetical protein EON63_12365 [archaeon]